MPPPRVVRRVVIGFCRDLWRTHICTVRKDYFYPHYLPDKTVEKAYAHPPPKMTKNQWKCCCDWFATPEFQQMAGTNSANQSNVKGPKRAAQPHMQGFAKE